MTFKSLDHKMFIQDEQVGGHLLVRKFYQTLIDSLEEQKTETSNKLNSIKAQEISTRLFRKRSMLSRERC